MILYKRVRKLCKEHELSYADLAEKTNFSRSYVGMCLSGRREISEAFFEALCKVFPGLRALYTCPCCTRPRAEPFGVAS